MQEESSMRKLFGLLLALCLLVSLAGPALAAPAMRFTEQPESQTVKANNSKNNAAVFSIKLKNKPGNVGITWYVMNPQTGEETAVSKVTTLFKGVKNSGKNALTLKLWRIPEEMHGWGVFVRVRGNGQLMDSDIVRILIKDMPEPEDDFITARQNGSASSQASQVTASTGRSSKSEPDEEGQETGEDPENGEDSGEPEPTPGPKEITVTARNALLYRLDRNSQPEGEGATSLTFTDSGDFFVKVSKEGDIQYWTINGMRFTPAEPITGFTLTGVTEDMSINVKVKSATAAAAAPAAPTVDPEADLDRTQMCKITCTDCYFSFTTDGISYATSGEVPLGAVIRIMAGAKGDYDKGYTVNGEDGVSKGKASFSLTVTGDMTISMKK